MSPSRASGSPGGRLAVWGVRVAWTIALAYGLFLSNLLLAPEPWWFIGSQGQQLDQSLELTFADYLQHTCALAVLGLTWGLARNASARPTRYWLVPGLMLYGGGTELLQHFVPLRTADPQDAAANAIGALLGWGVAEALTGLAARLFPGRPLSD